MDCLRAETMTTTPNLTRLRLVTVGHECGRTATAAGVILLAGRSFTICFGLLQIAIGIGASYVSRSVVGDALAIAGFTAGILLGVFGLGIFTRSAHQREVLAGMLCGIAVLTWVKFGTTIAWPWFAVIGSITTFVCGYLASQMISPRQSSR